MAGPDGQLMLAGSNVLLLGTIPGYVPDGERVDAAITSHQPTAIALGVPDTDVEAMEALIADPTLADGLEPDELDLHFLQLIAHWGATQFVPSPDLHAAHAAGLPVHGIDLPDDAHTDRFTATVKVRHLVRRGAVRKRLMHSTRDQAPDPHTLTGQWDRELCRVEPLAALEAEREEYMAARVRDLAADHDRLLVVVHAARLPGVLTHLRNGP